MIRPKIDNSSCAVLRRSSSPSQGTSIGNQGKTIDAAIAEHHLVVVYEKVLEFVSGSVPGNRSDIEQIIDQKKTYDNFQLLLVPDVSRFTRAGAGHGSKLLFDLRAAGLMIWFVAEDLLVHDELSAMYVSILLHAAHETAKAIGRGSTMGSTQSFINGKSPHCRQPPMGLDRMYSLGGKDLHIIRNLPDGTQQMFSPDGETLLRTFEKNLTKGVPNHYIKQKSESVRLVPGDRNQIATVNFIFNRHHIDKQSYRMIAKELNDLLRPSAEGKEWHTASVRRLLLNPIYVGRGIRYMTADGIYFFGGKDTPTPSDVELKELNERKHVRTRMRPKEDWVEKEASDLVDFLSADIRDSAKAKVQDHLDGIANGKPKTPNRDRHRQTKYILKGILRSKQGGYLMTGRPNKSGRKYAVSRASNVPKSNNVLANRVDAEAIEVAVLEKFQILFSNKSFVVGRLRQLVDRRNHSFELTDDAEVIQKQLTKKRRQLAVLSEDIDGDEGEDDPVLMKITAIRKEIQQVESRLRAVRTEPHQQPTDPAAAINKLARQLGEFVSKFTTGNDVNPEDVPYVNEILSLFVSKLEVDLVTKELEMELSLPSWVADRLVHRPVGLDELSACKPFIETHPENRLILGTFDCSAIGKPICFTCRPRPMAA